MASWPIWHSDGGFCIDWAVPDQIQEAPAPCLTKRRSPLMEDVTTTLDRLETGRLAAVTALSAV